MAKAISSHKQLISILVLVFLSFSSLISCTNSIQPAGMEQMHITNNPDDIDNMLKHSKALRKRVRIQTRSIYAGLIAGALGIVGGAAYAIYYFASPSPNTTNLSTIGYKGTAVLPITTPSTYLATTLESVTQRFENSSIDDILSSTPSTSSVNCPGSSSAKSNASSADLLEDFTRYLKNGDLDKAKEVIRDKNFNVNEETQSGTNTAFGMAVGSKNFPIAELLLACGADKDHELSATGGNFLMRAIGFKDVESLKFLLDVGLDPKKIIPNTIGRSTPPINYLDAALHWDDGVKILVNSGKIDKDTLKDTYEKIKNTGDLSADRLDIYKKLLLQE